MCDGRQRVILRDTGGREFFFSSRRRHTRVDCDWSSDVCSSDLTLAGDEVVELRHAVRGGRRREGRVGGGEHGGGGELTDGHVVGVAVGAEGVEGDDRSEERRVGKESRSRRCTSSEKRTENQVSA